MGGDSLGDRMKGYEKVADGRLMTKMPVILRVDGKAFHTFTRGLEKPWDSRLEDCMGWVGRALCSGIDGARLGYVQSDEVSILITDWATYGTQPWVGYRLQKLASLGASIATLAFERQWQKVAVGADLNRRKAMFDCRAFNVPHHGVNNYFLWRQQDAERNSIQGLAQSLYGHRELQGVSCRELVTRMEDEKGVVWGNVETGRKRGWTVERSCYGGWNVSGACAFRDGSLVAGLMKEGEL